mgnify:CR=1 FL=1
MKLLLITVEMNYTDPLTMDDRVDVAERLGDVLRRAHRRGALRSEGMYERGQRMVGLNVHPRLYPPPEDGHEAFKLGFWLRENPYPEGTIDYDRWRSQWRRRG